MSRNASWGDSPGERARNVMLYYMQMEAAEADDPEDPPKRSSHDHADASGSSDNAFDWDSDDLDDDFDDGFDWDLDGDVDDDSEWGDDFDEEFDGDFENDSDFRDDIRWSSWPALESERIADVGLEDASEETVGSATDPVLESKEDAPAVGMAEEPKEAENPLPAKPKESTLKVIMPTIILLILACFCAEAATCSSGHAIIEIPGVTTYRSASQSYSYEPSVSSTPAQSSNSTAASTETGKSSEPAATQESSSEPENGTQTQSTSSSKKPASTGSVSAKLPVVDDYDDPGLFADDAEDYFAQQGSSNPWQDAYAYWEKYR